MAKRLIVKVNSQFRHRTQSSVNTESEVMKINEKKYRGKSVRPQKVTYGGGLPLEIM